MVTADDLGGEAVGSEIEALARRLYPICRSITGEGVRETLRVMSAHAPIETVGVPSGTQVFDWIIPKEWVFREAWIRGPSGETVVDARVNNLHVLNYSIGVRTRMPLARLREHIYTLPEQPDLIPYRTSYYAPRWGFCMSHRQFEALPDGDYDIFIDAEHAPGQLNWGEYVHRGASEDEVLFSAHVCHPSLANDNCSGLALLTILAARLKGRLTRYTYRFLFAPGTIGAIAWLARNERAAARIRHGLVLSCVGDAGHPSYKRSRRGDATVDRAMGHLLASRSQSPDVVDFSPYGYDERQFCSPGFDLPVGLFQRSRFGQFPEYHTSADDLSFIAADHLAESYRIVSELIEVLETDATPVRTDPRCEPQLGKYGLYGSVGGERGGANRHMALLWALNLSDGRHSLLDMAERARLPYPAIRTAAEAAAKAGLLRF